ncbi:MAG: HD-GYP domain-containing protein [Acidaminobacteraceae bacterium]
MKFYEIGKVVTGMVLAEAIFNQDGSIELLSKGSLLTDRHIKLLKRLGILSVKIDDENTKALDVRPLSASVQADTVEKSALEADAQFDTLAFKRELEALDREKYDIPENANLVNRNMIISVLTGEGNIPIDKKHEESVHETKLAFERLREADSIDLDGIKKTIDEFLPDMLRNNDVLMRLNQLQKSDDYTFEHSFRVSILAAMIGKWIGYSSDQIEELASAALLFDMGKMKIPEFILKKPKVSEDEMEVIRRHSQFGYSILMKTPGVTPNIKYSALQHHERIDGSGYPLRIKGGQIHEFAKIIMICDVFDAITHDRPYKKKMSHFKAAEYISWQSGITLDSRLCYIFLTNIAAFYTGKEVMLSTGEKGRIIYVDVNFPTRPVVKVDNKIIDLVKEKSISVDELL